MRVRESVWVFKLHTYTVTEIASLYTFCGKSSFKCKNITKIANHSSCGQLCVNKRILYHSSPSFTFFYEMYAWGEPYCFKDTTKEKDFVNSVTSWEVKFIAKSRSKAEINEICCVCVCVCVCV